MDDELRLLAEAVYAEPELDDTTLTPFGFDRFARYVKRVPLLNAEQEQACARAIQLVKHDKNATEEQKATAEQAIWLLFHHNMRLVFSIAHQFYGPPFEDRVAEGFFGLRRACEDYDGRGRFSTYATNWIWHSINRGIADTANIIRLPAHSFDTYNRIRRAYAQLLAERCGAEPKIEEVAKRARTTTTNVRRLIRIMHGQISLDTPITTFNPHEHDDAITVGQCLPDVNIPDVDARVLTLERRGLLMDALERLAKVKGRKYAQVLILRYRLDEGADSFVGSRELRTYDELGLHFGVTRQRVQQYEGEARNWILTHCHDFVNYVSTA